MGNTPLTYAVRNADLEMAKFLLSHGAYMDFEIIGRTARDRALNDNVDSPE